MNVLSLFSGIGGIDLGLERAGMRVVAQCEIDPFCRAVLAKHWPDVPRFEDVRELHADALPGVDLVAGGFPCQDVSAAGKGAGIGGARSGLWREMARLIAECRPAWVLIENVPALRTRGADRVLADLEAIGYDAWPLVVGAWAVGAPHRRDRVWIVAHHDGQGLRESGEGDAGSGSRTWWDATRSRGTELAHAAGQRPDADESSAGVADGDGDDLREQSRGLSGARGSGAAELGRGGEALADSDRSGLREHCRAVAVREEQPSAQCAGRWPARPGERQHEWEAPRLVVYATGPGRVRAPEYENDNQGERARRRPDAPEPSHLPAGAGEPEFPMGGTAAGLSVGLVRLARRANREALKAYGNAVCPQVVTEIGKAILNANRRTA